MLHFLPFIAYGLGWVYFGRRFAGWILVNTQNSDDSDKSGAIFLGFFFGGFFWPIIVLCALVTIADHHGFFDVLIAEPREQREKRLEAERARLEAEHVRRIEQLERDTGIVQ